MRATVPEREMNKLEAAYALELELRKRVGEVKWFAFEMVKIRLADRTYYSPDFAVVMADDTLEIHEVKGFWEDDARVKIKTAAEHFPAKFKAITRNKQGWKVEEF